MPIDDGNCAFPVPAEGTVQEGWPGMSLRDYFASSIICGMVASVNAVPYKSDLFKEDGGLLVWTRKAYKIADAMIAARKEE